MSTSSAEATDLILLCGEKSIPVDTVSLFANMIVWDWDNLGLNERKNRIITWLRAQYQLSKEDMKLILRAYVPESPLLRKVSEWVIRALCIFTANCITLV